MARLAPAVFYGMDVLKQGAGWVTETGFQSRVSFSEVDGACKVYSQGLILAAPLQSTGGTRIHQGVMP